MRRSMPCASCCHDTNLLSKMLPSPIRGNSSANLSVRRHNPIHHLTIRGTNPSHSSAIHSQRSCAQPQAQSAYNPSSTSSSPASAATFASSRVPSPSICLTPQHSQQQKQPTHASRPQVHLNSSAASSLPVPQEDKPSGSQPAWWVWALLATALAGGGYILFGSETGILLRDWLAAGPMGQSGMLAAFSLILLSEIGDKTFFIAALLAMKLGRWISFIGSVAALSVMTAISVGIGAVCSHVPPALHSSVPFGELAGVALLIVFGIRTLQEGLKPAEPESKSDAELADAQTAVSEAQVGTKSTFSSIMEVATLIFVAEWGDRSMLATVALGASQDPLAVAAGAIAGHALATGIAVVVGAIACKYVSEKAINVISGALFLLFAAGTLYGMYIGAV